MLRLRKDGEIVEIKVITITVTDAEAVAEAVEGVITQISTGLKDLVADIAKYDQVAIDKHGVKTCKQLPKEEKE